MSNKIMNTFGFNCTVHYNTSALCTLLMDSSIILGKFIPGLHTPPLPVTVLLQEKKDRNIYSGTFIITTRLIYICKIMMQLIFY